MNKSEEHKEHQLFSTYGDRPKDFPIISWNLIIRGVLNDSLADTQHHLITYLIDQRVYTPEDNDKELFDDGYPERYLRYQSHLRKLDIAIRNLYGSYIFRSLISHMLSQIKRTNDAYLRLEREKHQREEFNKPSLIFKPKFLDKEEWYEFVDWIRFNLRYEPDPLCQALRWKLYGIMLNKNEDKVLYYKFQTLDHMSGYITYTQIDHPNIPIIKNIIRNLKDELLK